MPNTVQINTISPYHFVVYFGGIGLGAKNLCKNVGGGGESLPLPLLIFVLFAVSPFHRFDTIQYDGCDDELYFLLLLHRMSVSFFDVLLLNRDEKRSDLEIDLAEMLVMDNIVYPRLSSPLSRFILRRLGALLHMQRGCCIMDVANEAGELMRMTFSRLIAREVRGAQ